MRAKESNVSYFTCEGCDKHEGHDDATLRPGEVKVIAGWRDDEDDWIGDTDEYPTLSDVIQDGWDEDDVSEATYLECPAGHDSDDGWAIESWEKTYVCGVCSKQYTSLRTAAECCDDEEKN